LRDGQGVVAVDALIRISPHENPTSCTGKYKKLA